MDELFRRHDVAYYSSRALPTMIRADQELVLQLQEIDPESLNPQSSKYRQRGINFFTSPISHALGKPISACFRSRENPRAWVADENTLHELINGLDRWFDRYNSWRPHEALGNLTPDEVHDPSLRPVQSDLKQEGKAA